VKRELAAALQAEHGLSARQACAAVGRNHSEGNEQGMNVCPHIVLTKENTPRTTHSRQSNKNAGKTDEFINL
jgi:hypothetical protein